MEQLESRLFRGVQYPNICFGTVRIYTNGQVGVSYNTLHVSRRYRDTAPYVCFAGSDEAYYTISKTGREYSVSEGDLVYVDPKARITRDLLRNSKYLIKRDPSNAEYIVIPEPDSDSFYNLSYSFVAYDPNLEKLYMFSAINSYGKKTFSDKEIEHIKERVSEVLSARDLQFFYSANFSVGCKISLVPNIESYLDILENKYPSRKYVTDLWIDFNPTCEINIDTLEIWSRMDDDDILEKCIIGSDWKKYPLTLKTFFAGERIDFLTDYTSNKNARMVKDYINSCNDREILAEDWNMLQRWIMHKLGNDNCEKAFIPTDIFSKLSAQYRRFIRTKLAVAPVMMDTDIASLNNTLEMIEKS